MKRLLLPTAILCLGGCLNITGTYDVNKKVQVFVGEECINLNEDKEHGIVLAMTCQGQRGSEFFVYSWHRGDSKWLDKEDEKHKDI